MTREEAIVILDGFKHNPLFNEQHFEALDMAISALSTEGDLISRQAVIDGIEELKKSPWATDTRGTGFEYLIVEALDTVRDLVVKQVPSAEIKGDLISRQAVLDELEKWDWQDLYLPIHFKQILDDVPSVENKGEWIHPYRSDIACECSACHIQMPITDYFHYCPNCGADMRGE